MNLLYLSQIARVNGYILDRGREVANVAAGAGVVAMASGPVIERVGLIPHLIYQRYPKLINTNHCRGREVANVVAGAGVVITSSGPAIAGRGLMPYPSYHRYQNFINAHHLKSQLFRRLPTDVSRNIVKRAQELPWLNEDTIKNLQEGNVSCRLFDLPNWTDVAMKAYLEKKIDESTLHRLMIYAACQKESGNHVEAIKVFEPGGIQILKQALSLETPRNPDQKGEHPPIDCFLNESQWDQLLTSLRREPNRAQFFLIPCPSSEDQLELRNLLTNIKNALGTKSIFTVHDKGGLKMAVLPPDLLIEILKVKYGEENVPRALNIFGERNVESLSGNSRPIRIPCYPYLPCPREIHDGVPATDLAFYLHDIFYHLLIEASMGKEHRNLWIDLAKWVKPKSKKGFEYLLDKDMPAYSKEVERFAKSDRFWEALSLASQKHPELTLSICLYISQNQDAEINFEGFRKLYPQFSKFEGYNRILNAIDVLEKYPAMAETDYDRHKASVS